MSYFENYKKLIITFCVIFGGLALLTTLFSSCGGRNNSNTRTNVDRNYDDRDDGYVSPTSTGRTSSSNSNFESNCEGSGGGICSGDEDCEEICDYLFSSGNDEEECLELSFNEVTDLYNTFDGSDGLLADPEYEARNSLDELNNVCLSALISALTIKEAFFKDIYEDYSSDDARDVLLWFTQDESVYDALRAGYDAADSRNDADDLDNEIKHFIETLLNKVGNDSIIAGLKEELNREEDNIEDNTFFYYATDTLPDDALQLTHQLAQESCMDSAPTARQAYYRRATTYSEQACLLGELYCAKAGGSSYLFDEDSFGSFLDNSEDLDDYLEADPTSTLSTYRITGLGIADSSDHEDPEIVCPKFCTAYGALSKPPACI